MTYRILHRISRILCNGMGDNPLRNPICSCGFGKQLRVACLVKAVEEEGRFVDGGSGG